MAAAVGPATPTATPGALFACAGSLAEYAFAALVCTPLRCIRCPCTWHPAASLRLIYLTSRPRWPRPALHTPAGEKRPIAAILDAAALYGGAAALRTVNRRFRHPACKCGIVSIFCGVTRVKDRPVDHPER